MSWLNEVQAWCSGFEEKWTSQNASMPFWKFAEKEFKQKDWSVGFELHTLIKDFVATAPSLPQFKAHSNFGDPPLTLFYSKDQSFILDLYIWMKGHTSIHDHSFEGCFQVLQGTSLESTYRFEKQFSSKNSHWGKVIPLEMHQLPKGSFSTIIPTQDKIHRVLHLDRPTVSLVLRTVKETKSYIPLNYSFGCLASPSWPEDGIVVSLRLLDWYLSQDLQPPTALLDQVLDYKDTWEKLFRHPKTKTLAQKIALAKGHDMATGIIRQNSFQAWLNNMSSIEGKILLSAYEFYGENWTKWVKEKLGIAEDKGQQLLLGHLKDSSSSELGWKDDGRGLESLFTL